MLGKLIKHEWKSVYKLGSILLLAIFIVTVLGCIVLQTPIMNAMFSDSETQSIWLVLMSVLSFVVYVLLLVGAVYGILIYLAVRFYKSMYSDEGYLTHTLPATPHQILISKVLVSGVWVMLVYFAMILSIAALVISMIVGLNDSSAIGIDYAYIWSEIKTLSKEVNFDVIHFLVSIALICLVSPFMSIMQIFGALTIGQLSKKYKVMMGILTYIGLMIVNSIISSILQVLVTLYYGVRYTDTMTMNFMTASYDVTLLTSCIIGVAFYFVSHYIIHKKLNLD